MNNQFAISLGILALMKDGQEDGSPKKFYSDNAQTEAAEMMSVQSAWIESLVVRARAGEMEAFEALMLQHQRQVLTIASRLLGNSDEARDAAQEVFLRLHRYLHRFEDGRAFTPWLYRLTVNVCHDLSRRRGYSRTVSFEDEQEHGRLEHLTDAHTPEQALQARQQQRMIAAGLATLPEKERAAIVLRDIVGLETREVAEILQSSESTIRSQICSARIKLKKYRDQILNQK